MRICTLIVLLTLLSNPCFCQKPSATGSATAAGSCNTAVVGDNNQITINCQSKLQAEKMLAVMNKILANQLDPDVVTKKLDEILAARNSVNQSCQSAICAGGDITGNPTLISNAPPARVVSKEKEIDFKNALRMFSGGYFGILVASTSDDVAPLENKIHSLANDAGWEGNDVGQFSAHGGTPQTDGLECYSSNGWNAPMEKAFKAALAAASLKCTYFDAPYIFKGSLKITLNGLILVIGRNT